MTLSGTSNSMPSLGDAAIARAQVRMFCHGKMTRPRFNPGSIALIGSATGASIKFIWRISAFNGSGHFSERSANDAVITSPPAGTARSTAGATASTLAAGGGITGFGAGGATGDGGTNGFGAGGTTGAAGAGVLTGGRTNGAAAGGAGGAGGAIDVGGATGVGAAGAG